MKSLPKILIAALLALLVLPAPRLQAHESVPVTAEVEAIAGWETEPPIVGERNTLIVSLLQAGEPVAADRLSLRAELVAADVVKPLNVASTSDYRVTLIPTVTGEYGIHLRGEIDGQPVDQLLQAEPVLAADVLQFPNVVLGNADLQQGLIAIESRQAGNRQLTMVALGVAAAALAVAMGSVALSLRRSAKRT